MSKRKYPKLEQVLSYKNPEIIARFCKDFGVSKKTSELIFEDVLRLLWLMSRAKFLRIKTKDKKALDKIPLEITVLKPMLIMDEMWHAFILFTQDYTHFSHKYFGEYIHHDPAKILRPPSVTKSHQENITNLDFLLEFVWDQLGEETVDRWFQDYGRKYSPRKIAALRLKAAKDSN